MIREPHTSYLKHAAAPLPPLPEIRLGPGPAYRKFSYYDPDTDTVWLLLTDWHSRFSFYHELGHCFDRKLLTDTDRDTLERLLKGKRRRWFWGNWNPLTRFGQPFEETFADAYADCCLHPGRRRKLRRYLRAVTTRS